MLDTVFLPAAEPHSQRLMVVMHGLGDSVEGYRWLPRELNLPWLNFLLVNAPDPYYDGYSWFDLEGDPGPGIRRSRELLFQLLDQQKNAGFPTAQTALFGFSQGCLMILEAGLRYPHLFAGLVGISGFAYRPEELLQEMSPVALRQEFLITHGYHDSLLAFAMVKEQMGKFIQQGLRIDWREFDKDHTIAGETELRVIREFLKARFTTS
jgi:phospholipase/carboxylesterase